MSLYRLTEIARDDLWEIRDRINADNGATVATRIITELDDTLCLLTRSPGMGRARLEFTDEPVLFFPFYSWLIIYDPAMNPLAILRLVSSRRDLASQLSRPGALRESSGSH